MQHSFARVDGLSQYGKIEERILSLEVDHIVFKEAPLAELASLFSGKEGSPTVILYIYDGNMPKVSLEKKDTTFLRVLGAACEQANHVFWIEGFTIHIVPADRLSEHKNPKQQVIKRKIVR